MTSRAKLAPFTVTTDGDPSCGVAFISDEYAFDRCSCSTSPSEQRSIETFSCRTKRLLLKPDADSTSTQHEQSSAVNVCWQYDECRCDTASRCAWSRDAEHRFQAECLQPRRCQRSVQTAWSCSFFIIASSLTLYLTLLLSVHAAEPVEYDYEAIQSDADSVDISRSRSHSESVPSLRNAYTNQYAIRIVGGDPLEADRLAAKHGFINLGAVLPGDEYFLFESLQARKRSSRRTRSAQTIYITREPHVQWIEQQVAKRRVKRDYDSLGRRFPAVHQHRLKGNQLIDEPSSNAVKAGTQTGNRQRNNGVVGAGTYNLNDPLWSDMWYLNRAAFDRGMDHNVKEAWDLGYTGRGVVVTILDDGLERTHPDIAPNYDAKASYDVNDRDDDPTPRYEYTDENRHGTRCAGEVAAISNNSLCIVGIAYNARIGGIRMLDGDVTDAVEATSLGHNSDHIDIYSASWGPDDDGRTVDGPAKLTRKAFEKGIKEGRRGRGSIFVWASGNGGKDADSCNCDGYTNSIYTLSISSATEHGNIPWYSEACSSTLATAYSSGATGEKMIVTTDLHHSCTNAHTGTSASAPLAAGIVALTLEANPSLTWRDLQHIVVRTARPLNLRAGDWVTNGVGRNVSHSFGFGLMDAGAMVKLASNWTTVPEQHKCTIAYPARYKTIPHGNRLQLQLYTDGCAGEARNRVIYLEHVQSIITLTAPKRGDIQIYLTSPAGTRSTLLAKRARDTSRTGFREWAFMTTHNWGEMAPGLWTLEIDNDGWDDAELIRWDLVMYGTAAEVGPSGGIHSSMLAARSVPGGYHSDVLVMDSRAERLARCSLALVLLSALFAFVWLSPNS